MEPDSVVASFDGLKDGLARLLFILEVAIEEEFVFESAPERFHGGVIVAIALAAHAGLEAGAAELGPVDGAGVLATAIGVMEEAWQGLTMGEGHVEGAGDEAGFEVILHGPADDFTAIEIHDAGQVKEAFAGRQVSDVRDPDLIDSRRRRALGKPVGSDGVIMVAVGGAHAERPSAPRGQALLAHESFDAFMIAGVAASFEFVSQAGAAIGFLGSLKSAFNEKLKVEILLQTRSARACAPGVESAAREAQRGAQIADGIKWLEFFHSLAALGGWERMARVFFRISH